MPDLPQSWRDGFDEVAELYDRVRPGHPDDLSDELAAVLPRSPVVVEVGPGTGQATKGLVAEAPSSYHWVSAEERMTRPADLLRPGGYLALIAINQVASPADRGFFDEVHRVFSRHGLPGTHDPVSTHEDLVPSFVDEIVASPEFAEPSVRPPHHRLSGVGSSTLTIGADLPPAPGGQICEKGHADARRLPDPAVKVRSGASQNDGRPGPGLVPSNAG